jgi:hypothetical protein
VRSPTLPLPLDGPGVPSNLTKREQDNDIPMTKFNEEQTIFDNAVRWVIT